MTTNVEDILNDPEIKIVAEAIGGLHPAHEFVLAALNAGKHVVSANKQMIAAYYRELREAADANGVQLRFTPAAGGGIPWLSTLKRTARAAEIEKIEGILNGTTNFILDKMTRENAEFDDVLKEAQALGYAERNPAADIDGDDVRYKCTLSANLATGQTVDPAQVPAFGIRRIRRCDVQWLGERGRTVKLLGNLRRIGDRIAVFVQPSAQENGSLLAAVPKNFNFISLTGTKIGTLSLYGQGAGKDPTGFALAQDMLDIAEGNRDPAYRYVPAQVDNDAVRFRYYVRTPDVSAALAQVAEPAGETEGGTVLLTDPVSVTKMHAVAKTLPETAFIAAYEEL